MLNYIKAFFYKYLLNIDNYLKDSISNNNLQAVKFAVKFGANVNVGNYGYWKRHALSVAIVYDYTEISLLLIKYGARINVRDQDEMSPLLWAIVKDNKEFIKYIIDNDIYVFTENDFHKRILFIALVKLGRIDKILDYINKGVNIYSFNGRVIIPWNRLHHNFSHNDDYEPLLEIVNYSAIEIASVYNRVDIVKLLKNKGEDITERSILKACEYGSIDVLKFFFKKKRIDLDKVGFEALSKACIYNQFEIAEYLVKKGVDVNSDKPLHVEGTLNLFERANLRKNEKIIHLFLKNGIKFDDESHLYFAAKKGYVGIFKSILNETIKNNDLIKELNKCLIIATERWKFDIIEIILKYPIDINYVSSYNTTPLMAATITNSSSLVQRYIEIGAHINPSERYNYSALFLSSNEITSILLKYGADPNMQTENGTTPLIGAASKANAASKVKLLIEHGADIKVKNKDGNDALIVASKYCNFKIIEILLNNKIELNNFNNEGRNALLELSKNFLCEAEKKTSNYIFYGSGNGLEINKFVKNEFDNYCKTINLLITMGADVNAKDNEGRSALMYVLFAKQSRLANHYYEDIGNILISNGAELEVFDKYGNSLIDFILYNKYEKIIAHIEEMGYDINYSKYSSFQENVHKFLFKGLGVPPSVYPIELRI